MNTIENRTFVYAIGSENGPVKVGITRNLQSRIAALQTGSSEKLQLIWIFTALNRREALRIEEQFHAVHADCRLAGEWFDICAQLAFESLETSIEFQYGPFGKEFHQWRNAELQDR